MKFSLAQKRVWVAGHKGMVGSAIVRRLANEDCKILTCDRTEGDFRDQAFVQEWVRINKPQAIFLAAARVGGIDANRKYPAEFLYDNLVIAANIIEAAKINEIEKLLFLGSSCIYPRETRQPMIENALLSGPLEPTNQWYAIAKIAGLKLAEAYRIQYGSDFISCMPTNLYGPNDNYDLQNSHVLPALIRKIYTAKKENQEHVNLWGSGKPRREFLYVDDLADACIFLMKNYSASETINVGVGQDLSIAELATLIARIIGFEGRFKFDPSMPDGTPQKLLDISKLETLGWKARYELADGIKLAYEDFLRRFS